MDSRLRLVQIVLSCVYLASWLSVTAIADTDPLRVTKVRKQDGQTVEGQIQGVLVQKEDVQKSEEGSNAKYTVTYWLTKGEEIDAIDEEGVRLCEGGLFVALIATKEGSEPEDLEVVVKGMREVEFQLEQGTVREGALPTIVNSALAHGGSVLVMVAKGAKASVKTDRLLGQFRKDGNLEKLVPAIEVVTAKGRVTIPVANIPKFKRAAGEAE